MVALGMARQGSSGALKTRLANDPLDDVREIYKRLGLRSDYRVLTALADHGFSLEHTGGRVYVWQREAGPMTVSVQGAHSSMPPVSMGEAVAVEIEKDPAAVSFQAASLLQFLGTLHVVD